MRSLIQIISIFIILTSVSSTFIDDTCKVCEEKVKVLDPSLNMGKVSCTDHGEYLKGCDFIHEIKPICILSPLKNTILDECYHYHCHWQSKDNFKIKMSVKKPYDTIDIHIYPEIDMTSIYSLILMSVFIALLVTSNNAFIAGYAGGMLSSSNINTISSSGIC